jgi:putative ABC transport system ATP-binding protein
MSLIELKNVTKVYEEGDDIVHALDNVSIKIKDGEFIAIMGPSGSGKSTLLSILGGLNTPTDGETIIDEIAIYDLTLEKLADFRSEYLGFIFQSHQLIPYLTALENVMLPLSIIKEMKNFEQKKKAIEVLEKVGLSDKINRLPNQLSGGEQERVAIARAIVNEPPIILADEPTGNLDSKLGNEIMKLLKMLNDDGITIIMVTHDASMASYANGILKIEDGKILDGKEKEER